MKGSKRLDPVLTTQEDRLDLASSEDNYNIQLLENNKYDDSNKDYYVKYVEDESFRQFVLSGTLRGQLG